MIDLCTKEVVGWSMAEHMRTELVCDAVTMAHSHRDIALGAVFHSDRGSQYISDDFAKHLAGYKIVGSMGRTG